MKHWLKLPLVALFALAPLVGLTRCGTRPEPDAGAALEPKSVKLVELFSWWTAPGEGEALQALIATHRQTHPHARLFNAAAASGSRAQALLAERLKGPHPPDLFQKNAHDVPEFLRENPGALEPLDELFHELQLEQVVYPEVLANLRLGGHYYSMPVNIHRENALFYNARLFAEHGLAPPSTFSELMQVCKKLKAAGVTPIATADQGWILRVMFNSIAMGKMGAAHFHAYFMGQLPADDAELRDAISTFGDILAQYTNVDAKEEDFGWTNAAQAVYNGDAAMFFHGDWAKGYFTQLGWVPGVDFGVVGAPGASEVFLYGVDVFAVPKGALNERGAREFLTTVASPAGQIAFNTIKGSSPIRRDIPSSALDTLGRATVADLQNAKIRMLIPSRPGWDEALQQFAKDGDVSAVMRTFIALPPEH
ncbi:MAG: ABC transporter substrate-binding protein [Polyangiaceae bacterium]